MPREKKPKPPKGRVYKYLSVGISTFLFDLLLLVIFSSVFSWNYLVSTGVAFIVAVSCNYLLSRKYVFHDTTRPTHLGYFIFILIAFIGLVFVTSLMAVFVGEFHINYIVSRVIIAAFIGVWNYLANFYFNFKVENH